MQVVTLLLRCADPGQAAAHRVCRLLPLPTLLCTSSDHKGLTWQIKGGNRERWFPVPDPFLRMLPHPKKGARSTKFRVKIRKDVFLWCPAWDALPGPQQLLGRSGRENKLFKGTRLQGSRLIGRFYKYLLNKTLPVNWWHRARCGFPSRPRRWLGKLVWQTSGKRCPAKMEPRNARTPNRIQEMKWAQSSSVCPLPRAPTTPTPRRWSRKP